MANRNSADRRFMRVAIEEARLGVGCTAPNPAVGAAIVRDGNLLARGHHRAAGGPHAEIAALNALPRPDAARGADLYVTLEPCSTFGRTPPCTEAIIRGGIRRVIYGATDPTPRNGGKARAILEAAGIEVVSGVEADACESLNRAWHHWAATGMPFVTAKAGLSLDGRITPLPGRRWITSKAARADAMRLRAEHDAILVGGGTLRADNPRLTVRGTRAARQPLRVIWTKSGNLPPGARALRGAGFRVFAGTSLRACLRELGAEGIQSVLIEGGGRTLGEAFDRGLVQRAVFYIAPVLIGGPTPAVAGRGCATPAQGWLLENPGYRTVGGDLRVEGRVIHARD